MQISRFLTAALVLFLFSATIVNAQRGDCIYMQKRFNLSDKQIESVQTLRNALDKDMIDLRADLDRLRLEKRDLCRSDKFSKSSLKAIEEKFIAQQTKIRMKNLDFRMSVYDLLDDKQKEEWKKAGSNFGNNRMNNNKMNRNKRFNGFRNNRFN
ncbi:MAG: Spy/CpxP family protein refolding chaperone [Ignavibacteriaceae bacterium]|jgi:Spy/CpxP family protein refolding chaperone